MKTEVNIINEEKQDKYELIITAESIVSSDERFTMDDLRLGDKYKLLDCFYKNIKGQVIRRILNKGERKYSNKTIPILALQLFENDLIALTVQENENFPICNFGKSSEVMRGIFPTIQEIIRKLKTRDYLDYKRKDGKYIVIPYNGSFSTVIFVQECLKRFGKKGEEFILIYSEKMPKEDGQTMQSKEFDKTVQEYKGYLNPYSKKLKESKNIIFRGAPGTGKSYLAKEIAADIISNGDVKAYSDLTEDQKKQIEFVQFHPNYDYSDFVEGLRPKLNMDGSVGFELRKGIFKKFILNATKNIENASKTQKQIETEFVAKSILNDYFSIVKIGIDVFKTTRGTEFYITEIDDNYIWITIPDNKVSNRIKLKISELSIMLESDIIFNQAIEVTRFLGKKNGPQEHSYNLAVYKDIIARNITISKTTAIQETIKPFVFIIDEINRGEISKIFGELFFAIDPGYRGITGEVSTQYANLHEDPSKKFYIPENVYIIGTMNDIDRSVDSFDFAMRRRFRFLEIKADERLEMLDSLGEELKEQAILRMTNLNEAISNVDELNENYHIGASYFLKLKDLDFDALWSDYLQPLLEDYIRGMYDEVSIMQSFEKAYTEVGTVVADD